MCLLSMTAEKKIACLLNITKKKFFFSPTCDAFLQTHVWVRSLSRIADLKSQHEIFNFINLLLPLLVDYDDIKKLMMEILFLFNRGCGLRIWKSVCRSLILKFFKFSSIFRPSNSQNFSVFHPSMSWNFLVFRPSMSWNFSVSRPSKNWNFSAKNLLHVMFSYTIRFFPTQSQNFNF